MIITFESWLSSWILACFLLFSGFSFLPRPSDIFFRPPLLFLAFAYALLFLTSLGHSSLEAGPSVISPPGHLPAAPVLLLPWLTMVAWGVHTEFAPSVKPHLHKAHLTRWALWLLSLSSNESMWVPDPRSLMHSAASKTTQAHGARETNQRALHSTPTWPGEGPMGWPSRSCWREKAWHPPPTPTCTQSTPCRGWHLHSWQSPKMLLLPHHKSPSWVHWGCSQIGLFCAVCYNPREQFSEPYSLWWITQPASYTKWFRNS